MVELVATHRQSVVAKMRGALREVPHRRMLATMRLAEGIILLLAAVSGVALAASGQLAPSGQVVPGDPAASAPPAMTVVIDPGHGGDYRGAVGPAGMEEKRLTLSVAQRVKALGADRGERVLLTREDDRQIPLMQRAAFANGAGAFTLHQPARQRQPVAAHHRRRSGIRSPFRTSRFPCPL